jgi:Bax protein
MLVVDGKRLREFLKTPARAASIASHRLKAGIGALRTPLGVASVSLSLVAVLIATMPKPEMSAGLAAAGTAVRQAAAASPGRGPARVAAPAAVAGAARVKPIGVNVVIASAQKLFSDFRSIGYRLEDLRKGKGDVPRVFVKQMPMDIGMVRSTARRKSVFIKTMLPLILHINEELRAIRARVEALAEREARGGSLPPAEHGWLALQYDRFDVEEGHLEILLRRIDVVPPSLAMAQGAEESGWGSSRFALEGRALFGQRTFKKTPGIVPLGRTDGNRFKVRSFDHLLDGVRSYVHNLNTHPAYAGFRVLRARLRAEAGGDHGLDSLRLVEALESYSERGAKYIETIKSIIRHNELRSLDDDRLSQAGDGAATAGPA